MWVLGIESSCDETAAAVVSDEGLVRSDVIRSQIESHAPYGGVVPEIASRDHTRAIVPVVDQALSEAGVSWRDLGGIAVTARPGLSGALLVGMQVAKGISWATGLPLVGVDHLVGHLLAVFLRRTEREAAPVPRYPFVALLASGGHTALYRVDGPSVEAIRELGATRDDAAGEAFDKVGKLLGLGYPGGPIIDKLAATGDAARGAAALPKQKRLEGSLELSFSGIKASVARYVTSQKAPLAEGDVRDIAAAFQAAVVDTLVRKTVRAAKIEGLREVVIAGGVAANRGLRASMAKVCEASGLRLSIPPFSSCTDNAAMIAYAGAQRLARGERDDLSLSPSTVTSLPRVTRKGGGAR